jgi:hypothetical protein
VAALQAFVYARLADLTTVGGLKTRARQALRAVAATPELRRNAASNLATGPTRPPAFMVGRELPRIRPGVERC